MEKLRNATQQEKSAVEFRVERFSDIERRLAEIRELLMCPETACANTSDPHHWAGRDGENASVMRNDQGTP